MRAPRWLILNLQQDNFRCIHCKADFDHRGIVALGLQDSPRDGATRLFCNYECNKCHKYTTIEMHQMSIEEFAMHVLSSMDDETATELKHEVEKRTKYHEEGAPKAKPRKTRSKITRAEQQEAIKMLNACETWEDWLKLIGAPLSSDSNDGNIGFKIENPEPNPETPQ